MSSLTPSLERTAPLRVPGAMLFTDLLPGEANETDEHAECRVRFAVEAEAPLPLNRLAWGWCRVSVGVFYYVGTRDRLAAIGARVDSADTPVCLPFFEPVLLPDGVTAEELESSLTSCAFADLRDRELMARLRTEARLAGVLGRVYRGLALVALAGAACLVAAAGLTVFNRVREARLRADAGAIAATESKFALLSVLERGEDGPCRAFEVLADLNTSRPSGVVFSRFELRDGRAVALAGRADSVDAANRFVGALRASGRFTDVVLENLDTARGRTTFRLKLGRAKQPAATPATAKGGAA